MAHESYEDAIAGLTKLLSEKADLGSVAAAKIKQITAELEGAGSEKFDPVERIKSGFVHFKTEKYENMPVAKRTRSKEAERIREIHKSIRKKKVKVTVIELSDDDNEEENQLVPISKQTPETPNCSIWYCVTPRGFKSGPYSMATLKRWNDLSAYGTKFKVWKAGQRQEEAVLLSDAIGQSFAVE